MYPPSSRISVVFFVKTMDSSTKDDASSLITYVAPLLYCVTSDTSIGDLVGLLGLAGGGEVPTGERVWTSASTLGEGGWSCGVGFQVGLKVGLLVAGLSTGALSVTSMRSADAATGN